MKEGSSIRNTMQPLEQIELNLNYLDTLSNLNLKTRYGRAIQNKESLSFVLDIYNKHVQNSTVNQLLVQLKNNDSYTFLHSIDVFTLGTLFARHLQLPLLEVISLGYLFYDIGKGKIPHRVLNKQDKLTRIEYDMIKNHTFDGQKILNDVGLEQIAYFAGLHHERHDGSGYPNGLRGNEMPIEIEILHIIDTFSAITLERVYKLDKHSTDAMTILCQEKHLFNQELLHRFINFIGIYPKGSMVLLSNGCKVMVEQTNFRFPLLPKVKCITTGNAFTMPEDGTVVMEDFISFEVETIEKKLNNFFDLLIRGENEQLAKCYKEYKEKYQPHELFLKVFIPIYQTLLILKDQSIVTNVCYNRAIQKFHLLLQSTIEELKSINRMHQTYLIILPEKLMMDVNTRILEGLLHVDGIYPLITQSLNNYQALQSVIETCQLDGIIFIGEETFFIEEVGGQYDKYHISSEELKMITSRFIGTSPHQFNMLKYLENYLYTPGKKGY